MNALLIAALSLLSIQPLASPSKVLLRLKPDPGKEYSLLVDTRMTMQMMAPGMPEGVNMNINSLYALQLGVTSVEEKGKAFRVEQTLDSMRMSMSGMPGVDMSYNSNDAASNAGANAALAETIQPLLQARISALVTELGRVQEFQGMEALYDALGGSGGAQGMSSNPFENLQSYFPIFPGGKVSVGSTWKEEATLSNNGTEYAVNYTYTLKGLDKTYATLNVVTNLNMPETTMEQGGMEMTISMRGTQSGEMKVRLSDGMTDRGELAVQMNMDMSTMGMSMPATIGGTISLSGATR